MSSTTRARALTIIVLLLSYGAVGARQPAVRTSVVLPVPSARLARVLGLDPGDRSQLMVSIVRLVFDAPDGLSLEDQQRRAALAVEMSTAADRNGDRVPLPLDISIWRETILPAPVPESDVIGAIFSERSTALLYHGLAALDDETLGWLGPDRETLLHLRRNAGVFAVFGRSVRVRSGRVVVPGGTDAEPVWAAVVGADPTRPSSFVQRLIRGNGRLAWFYDTVLHLDSDRQRLVFGKAAENAERIDRLRDLLEIFESASPEWQIPERPFVRPSLDPAAVLQLVAATRDGEFEGPADRRIWELAFRETPAGAQADSEATNGGMAIALDPAWVLRRIVLAPPGAGRRRLETFLFAQRVFGEADSGTDGVLPAVRAAAAYPALALTLERIGISEASTYTAAGRAAAALDAVHSPEWRRVAIAAFQSTLAIIDRAVRTGGLERREAGALVGSLAALPITIERGFDGAFTDWVRTTLLPVLPFTPEATDPVEESVLAACAGVKDGRPPETIEWEGRRYRVASAAAEWNRLKGVRARHRAHLRGDAREATLGAQLAAAADAPADARLTYEQRVAETLTSIVYALHLGEPDGPAASSDVWRRHEFGFVHDSPERGGAWTMPREEHGHRTGWRLRGSLLGLDAALARLALRRLDATAEPAQSAMSTSERLAVALTAAFFGPVARTDRPVAEVAAAIGRGRARVDALGGNRSAIDDVVRDAGLSEWRREAVAWTLEHEPANLLDRFSLVELFWLGSPRGGARAFDAWGAATAPVDGCLCLRMPDATQWEFWAGRPAAGFLATRAADVSLRVAELLAELKLPSALAPAVMGYAVQDTLDLARPAFSDDWGAFQRAARELPRDRLLDYIAATAADGVLVLEPSGRRSTD